MEKEFVTYEQAKILHELGFNENCFRGYDFQNGKFFITDRIFDGHFLIYAPLKQQAFRWFREVTGWDFAVIKEFNDKDYPYYFYILFADTAGLNKHCKSYEEAESLLIDELIENYKFGNAH
jgi:hypothetical protein